VSKSKSEDSSFELVKTAIFLLAWWKLYLVFGGGFTAASFSLWALAASFLASMIGTSLFMLLCGAVIVGVLYGLLEFFCGLLNFGASLADRVEDSEKTKRRREAKRLQKRAEQQRRRQNDEARRIAEAELGPVPDLTAFIDGAEETKPKETVREWQQRREREVTEQIALGRRM
jgi:hypothetical protein